MNKLDLIFEKQPPQVQRKLMNLLIQYNAVMQYNRDDDKFEVDLLLPFKNENQKEQFMNQFKQRQRRSESSRYEQTIQNISQIQQKMGQSQVRYQSQKNEQILQLDEDDNMNNNDLQMSSDAVNDKEESSMMSKNLFSMEKFQLNLRQNLNHAIEEIRVHRFQQKSQSSHFQTSKVNEQEHSIRQPNQQSKDSIMEERRQEDSSVSQNNTQNQNKIESPQVSREVERSAQESSQRIQREQVIGNQFQENHSSIHENPQHSTRLSSSNNQILIQDTQYFYEEESNNKHNNSANYQSNFEYPQIIQERIEEDEEELFQNSQSQSSASYTIEQQKQKLRQKYKKKKPAQSNSLRSKYSQFLKKNRKDIDKIYENIRKDIVRKKLPVNKSKKPEPILILQDNISETDSQQEKAFKQEIIKEYKKNIVAENDHLSSQDLVRYFRYLQHNARSLYVKRLRKVK